MARTGNPPGARPASPALTQRPYGIELQSFACSPTSIDLLEVGIPLHILCGYEITKSCDLRA